MRSSAELRAWIALHIMSRNALQSAKRDPYTNCNCEISGSSMIMGDGKARAQI